MAQAPAEIPLPIPVGVTTGEEPTESKVGFDEASFVPYKGKLVSSITLIGNKHTKNYVATREIWTKVGQPLSVETLAADHQRLQNIQVFSSVHIVPAAVDSSVALVFYLHEMPPVLLYPALSFTDQNGWSYGAGASSINLMGRNISASGKVLFGGTTTFSFSASDPWITGNHVSAKATIAHLEYYNELDAFEQTDRYALPWVGTYMGKFGRAGATINWLQVRSNVAGKTLSPDNVDNMYNTGFYLQYDSRTSVRAPNNGW
jgi:outer membrane protein assembly factor BamA